MATVTGSLMKEIYFLFAIVFLAVTASPSGHAAARNLNRARPIDTPRRLVGNTVPCFQSPRFFADNRSAGTPDKGMRKNEQKETHSGPKTEDAASHGKANKPGLKPFVPSEKIESDQAVDFPYDI